MGRGSYITAKPANKTTEQSAEPDADRPCIPGRPAARTVLHFEPYDPEKWLTHTPTICQAKCGRGWRSQMKRKSLPCRGDGVCGHRCRVEQVAWSPLAPGRGSDFVRGQGSLQCPKRSLWQAAQSRKPCCIYSATDCAKEFRRSLIRTARLLAPEPTNRLVGKSFAQAICHCRSQPFSRFDRTRSDFAL